LPYRLRKNQKPHPLWLEAQKTRIQYQVHPDRVSGSTW
jgi:hypothetical protein